MQLNSQFIELQFIILSFRKLNSQLDGDLLTEFVAVRPREGQIDGVNLVVSNSVGQHFKRNLHLEVLLAFHVLIDRHSDELDRELFDYIVIVERKVAALLPWPECSVVDLNGWSQKLVRTSLKNILRLRDDRGTHLVPILSTRAVPWTLSISLVLLAVSHHLSHRSQFIRVHTHLFKKVSHHRAKATLLSCLSIFSETLALKELFCHIFSNTVVNISLRQVLVDHVGESSSSTATETTTATSTHSTTTATTSTSSEGSGRVRLGLHSLFSFT